MGYEVMHDFERLYEAYKKCRRGKLHKTEVIQFELDLSQELVRLKEELETKTYRLGNYYHFTIYDPKKREIQALVTAHASVSSNGIQPILSRLWRGAGCFQGEKRIPRRCAAGCTARAYTVSAFFHPGSDCAA